ncbi:hypothetical protein D3C87_1031120 [compost metagenome]
MPNLQPDLSGNPFLLAIKFYLTEIVEQKRLGTEGGNCCPKNKLHQEQAILS